jgi:hypothetical protein
MLFPVVDGRGKAPTINMRFELREYDRYSLSSCREYEHGWFYRKTL